MNRPQLIREIISLWNEKQNKQSKWYATDLKEFKVYVNGKTDEQLRQQFANLNALAGNDKRFNRQCDKIEKQLFDAGMFDIGGMRPENCLD